MRLNSWFFNLRRFKKIFTGILWTLIALYLLLVILLHLSPVQGYLGKQVSSVLSEKLGTEVSIGRVDLGFFNRIIIDKLHILDQQGDSLLDASRVAAKIDFSSFSEGRIVVGSAQLFGLKANLYKQDAHTDPNFKFVLDSLASRDTTKHTPLDLQINSLIIRNGAIKYNQRDVVRQDGIFSPSHLDINKLSAHIILNRLTDDNIDLNIKKLSFAEKSGLKLTSLTTHLIADKQKAQLTNFELNMPGTTIILKDAWANYQYQGDSIDTNSIQFGGSVYQSRITPSDIACLVPELRQFKSSIYADINVSGTGNSLSIPSLRMRAGDGSLNIDANGSVSKKENSYDWQAHIENLNMRADGIKFISENFGQRFDIPVEVIRLGNIHYQGKIDGSGQKITSSGNLDTSAGGATIDFTLNGKQLTAQVETDGLELGRILDDDTFGNVATKIHVQGTRDNLHAKGNISQLTYNNYTYNDIDVDAAYIKGKVDGHVAIDDPNLSITVDGQYNTKAKQYTLTANLRHMTPSTIMKLKSPDPTYQLTDIYVEASNEGTDQYFLFTSPFADINIQGEYDYATLAQSITNLVGSKLPTLPGLPPVNRSANNNFDIHAIISDTQILSSLFDIPLTTEMPIAIDGNIEDAQHSIDMTVSMPRFTYDEKLYRDGYVRLTTPNDTLKADISVKRLVDEDKGPTYHLMASAAGNRLDTRLAYKQDASDLPIEGQLHATSSFYKNTEGQSTARVNINPSELMLGETKWEIQPSSIVYSKNNLSVDHFMVSHGAQHIIVNGAATPSANDSLLVDLKDVDVAYILNLVNFHSVEFSGSASGQAKVSSLFNGLDAKADIDVEDFRFENGRMGVLHAHVDYDNDKGRIDIDAVADDGPEHQTVINGNVSPKENTIDLGIIAQGTSIEFLHNFCGSFMDNIEAWCDGRVSLIGKLNDINLVGGVTAHGKVRITPLEVDYTFRDLQVKAIPDEIIFLNDSIFDRDGHYGILSGSVYHQHLTKISYDLNIDAHNLLCFDTHTFGDDTFYGTVYADGNCNIKGKSGETVISMEATPCAGTEFVYNAASPEAIGTQDFIEWNDVTTQNETSGESASSSRPVVVEDIPSDLYMNFLINANPNLTLKLLMDTETGDYIALNGNGVIRANYFNKGSFDMFGNYLVDGGIYKLTIQNIIRKDFDFLEGGTITFGGDAYQAALNLQARHIINSVPLSDLNIGRSFSSNNTRVDCMMNITGTPLEPKVDFSLDMPSVSTDVKQMIYSVINSEEEMNQQVIYLLAVGRFMMQENNSQSESGNQQSGTSLAMQSLLSGTLSQQINSVLSGLIDNNNWNFGANISTGDEGFNNAEYEGILSGRMLNNRLIFNGQFGYRDNANATTSFIGDFDLRYNLTPNGNFAVRVYNQTNDRYFTRNSLNTQGLGFILKKDFSSLKDLFGIKSKKKKKKKEKEEKENEE